MLTLVLLPFGAWTVANKTTTINQVVLYIINGAKQHSYKFRGLNNVNLSYKSNCRMHSFLKMNTDYNASVLYTDPLYNIHKRTHSPSNKALIACYDPELKTNEGRTGERRRQTSWLPCRCVWRL